MAENNEKYDIIIVGGGCAGYPAAMYAKRFNLKTLVINLERGGLITTTHLVENWPGEVSLTGQELADKLENHATKSGAEILDDKVQKIRKLENGEFEIKTEFNELSLFSKTIILATGTKHRHLGIESEKKLQGKGVSYCATCDGGFFKDKEVVIVGGGDSSVKEAMVLANLCKKVTMIVRTNLKGEPINNDRIKNTKNVEILENSQVKDILGENEVEGILLQDNTKIECQGVFIAIGLIPQNELAKQLNIELNEKGEIIIDKDSNTNIEGVFASGDLTNANWKQGIVAAAEGAVAANSAFEFIQKSSNKN